MWRPDEWDSESIVIAVYQELTTESTDEKERKLVEAGADAILKALREQKHSYMLTQLENNQIGVTVVGLSSKGILAFIPDEEG